MPWVTYALTCAVEIPVYLLLARRFGWVATAGRRRVAFAAWLVNVTQPVLTAVHPRSWELLLVLEAVVAAVEGMAFWLLLRRHVRAASLGDGLAMGVLANAASFLVGVGVLALVPS